MVDSVNLGSLYATVELRSGNLQGGINQAVAQFDAAGKKINAAAVGLAAQVGRSMTLAGAGMAAGLGVAVKAAADFDQAMRNTNSLLKMNEQGFQDLKKSVADLANDPKIRQGPNDLAKAMYDVASSGFQGQQALDILRQSAYGASAGMTDTATSSRVLMAVLNSGVSGVKNAREAMDVLFREVDLGVNTFEQLANTLGDVLPTAKIAGVSLQEVSAALAVMTRRGINVNEATTALNQLMVHIIKPGKDAVKLMDELGIAHGAAALQAKGLTGVLEEIIQKTHGNKQALTELVPEIRGMKALLALTDEGGRQYTEMLAGMKTATDAQGATQKALTEQNKGAQAQMEMLRKSLEQVAIEVGNNVLPGLRHLVGGLRDALEWFSKLPDPVKTDAIQIAAVGTAALFAGGALITLAARVVELRAAMIAAGITGAGFVAMMGRAAAVLNPAALTATGVLLETNAGGDNALSTMPKGSNALKFWQDRLRGLQGAARNGGMTASLQQQINFAQQRVKEIGATTPAPILPSMIRPDAGAAGVDKILADLKNKSRGGGGPDTTAADERASASRTVADDIYALTHGEYDVRRRRAQQERDDAIASGVARVDAERRYQLELTKIHQEAAAAQRKTEADALGAELAQQHEMIAQTLQNIKETDEARQQEWDHALELASQGIDRMDEFNKTVSEAIELQGGLGKAFGDAFKTAQYYQNVKTAEEMTKSIADQLDRSGLTQGGGPAHVLKPQFDFMKEFASSLADEFYDGFSRGLEKVFGRNPIGRALARTLDKWMSSLLDQGLASLFNRKGVGNGIVEGDMPNVGGLGMGGALIPLLLGGLFGGGGGILGGIFKGVGGLFKGIGHIFGFADGGIAPPGRISLVGERGPELIMPASATRVVPLDGGGVTTIHAPITVHAAPGMDTRQLAQQIGYEVYKLQRVRAGSG